MNGKRQQAGISIQDTAMELKCVVTAPVLRHLNEKCGEEEASRLIRETGMDVDYLADVNNWVSFDYFCRLLGKTVEITGNPRAAYEAALRHSDRSSFSAVGLFLIHLGTPGTVYRLVADYHRLWNTISECRLTKLAGDSCAMSVRYPGRKQDRNNCLALQGSLAAVPLAFGLPSAEIRERECACDGADACVYEIHWINKPARLWGYLGALAGLVVGAVGPWLMGREYWAIAGGALLALAGYFAGRVIDYKNRLGEVYAQNEEQAASLLESIRATEKLNQELQERVEQRTRELSEANQRLEQALKDLRDSQEKALLAERQAAVGALASGMAHEMNSPLNAIRLSVQALREDVGPESPLMPVIQNAGRAANRCARIVNDFLSFSREAKRATRVSLEEILDLSLALFEREHPGNIRFVRRISAGLPRLLLDGAQVQQAILNVLANASDAMGGQGEVEIDLVREGDDTVLRVTDHGPGMSEEVRRRVFDPFFTTKSTGTGLGLCITYQLVLRNGGMVDIESREGKGTTCTLRFPPGEEGAGAAVTAS